MIYAFDGYELDTDRIELRDEGVARHVEPQVFDVLCYLLEHRDRVVSKIELFENVWGGAFVGESALTSRIKSARQLVGDSGQAQRVIRTVQRRGYQFVADVTERREGPRAGPEADGDIPTVPSGTVSFLLADIEGSSGWWERHPDVMGVVTARHNELVHGAVAQSGGVVFPSAAGGVAAAFVRATDAVAAARSIRAALDDEAWPDPIEPRVRLGVHTGEALRRNDGYVGAAVARAAQVMAAAHGGQTLVSDVTAAILAGDPGLVDLGLCRLDAELPSMRLWQVDGPSFPPLLGAVVAAPPVLRTELIGRVADLERVVDAVAEHRLVSIVGPGGAGKTTLALAAANSVVASFPAGVVFVELASARDGGGIFRAVAETAGVEGAAAADVPSLARHLARRSMLLVLDNCEHLLDECADFIDAVLDAGPEVTLLTTSREPVGTDGELVVPLGSLDVDAPTLFVTRALAATADLDAEPEDPRIEQLCRRLDGLPLAIELAAAQLRHLRLDDLVARLDVALEMSSGGRTRGRNRHLTLDRTISWSYDLLDESAQWLLRQFGAFPGTFDLAAAEAVGRRDGAPDALTTLSDLVAKSLVVWDAATGRYRLLETIRAFASQRLDDADESEGAGERLRRYVVARATATSRLDRWLSGRNAAALRIDFDNVRFAFDRSMWSGNVVDALEIHVGCSYLFRNTLSCVDGRRWAARLEPVEDELEPVDRLWALLVRADLAQGTANHALASATAAAATARAVVAGAAAARVIAQQFEALHHVVTDPDVAQARLDDAMELARSVDDDRLEHLLRAFSAVTALAAGRIDDGTAAADAVGHDVSGDGYEVFIANWAAWTACLIRGDAARLRFWRERQRDYLTRVGVPEPWLFLWSTALVTAMEGGDATDGLRRARERAEAEGHDVGPDVVLALALVERLAGRHVEAAELLGVVMGHDLNNLSHYVLVRTLRSELRSELGDDAVRAALARGGRLDPDDVLDARGLGPVEPRPIGAGSAPVDRRVT